MILNSNFFLIQNNSNAESDTFFDTDFLKSNSIPLKKLEKFPNRKVLNPKCHTLISGSFSVAIHINFTFGKISSASVVNITNQKLTPKMV